ncbi:hypothetical protein [Ureibacillus thermosphaericus]|uniref:Putative PP-loop superfamily ATPase n=1 Tax=Ureibacillus thermosphaericus TaxID=51173 RepID=A0A840PJT6_URETH|nr:hypothetical protein [Ureibacillus thermosphaericus]MBB5148675.1 putative PP-loop superfamily ATPase [Ureibacillus thermosphaericus]NKZ31391.1 hypothetical protein [Ureibacillus thermosphaericus]
MNSETNNLIHKQIILDLTIRTLERDSKYIKKLKLHYAIEEWISAKIKELQNDLKTVKSQLYKFGVKIQSENRLDESFTEYIVLERGLKFELKYSNIALRNWVNEEAKRLLGLPYRKSEYSK